MNLFPEEFHNQIRLNLSMNLRATVSQRLVPGVNGSMTVAMEVMLNQGLVKDLILKGEIIKIRDIMEQNTQLGMCSFDQSLFQLFKEGRISEETAISQSDQSGDLKIKIQQFKVGKGDPDTLKALDTTRLRFSD